jgi:Zn-dependent protease
MTWSWKVARIAGVDVYVHATFLVLLGWIAIRHWVEGRTLAAVAAGVGFILLLFGCVILHEFGHALAARRYGIQTRDITLLPIGGLARLERMPEQPMQELWVALAGPAVNGVIALVLFLWLQVADDWVPLQRLSVGTGSTVGRLLIINVGLLAFNLLPAFPMDGGRALRALLATRLEYTRATQLAASIGQGMAIIFAFFGLFANPGLLFIAFFVWIGAAAESSVVQMKSSLAGIPLRRAMLTHFRTLAPTSTLGEAVDLVLSGSQQDFPVVLDGQVHGMLTRQRLVKALQQRNRETPVAEVMTRECMVATAGEMLDAVLARVQGRDCRTLPVMDRGLLIGLVTMDNIGEFLMFQSAENRSSTRER